MPLYTIHCTDTCFREDTVAKFLSDLHARTFATDPALVRIEFILGTYPKSRTFIRYGGPLLPSNRGAVPFFERQYDIPSAYMIVSMDFRGTAESWTAYCDEITAVYPKLMTIYLQKLEYEYEVKKGVTNRFESIRMGAVPQLPLSVRSPAPEEDTLPPPYSGRT